MPCARSECFAVILEEKMAPILIQIDQLQTIHPCLVEPSLLLPTLVEAHDVGVRRQELMLPNLLQLGVSITVAFILLFGFLYCV